MPLTAVDPVVVLALVVSIALYRYDNIGNGYRAAAEVVVVSSLVALIYRAFSYHAGTVEILGIGATGFSLTVGLLYAFRWVPEFNGVSGSWNWRDPKDLIRGSFWFLPIIIGAIVGVGTHIVVSPDIAAKEAIYGYHTIVSFEVLKNMEATIPQRAERFIPGLGVLVGIALNNAGFTLRSFVAGMIGGLNRVFFGTFFLVVGISQAITTGIVLGAIANQSIVASGPITGPLVAYTATFGLVMVVGHTLWEFWVALALAGVAGVAIASGTRDGDLDIVRSGVIVAVGAIALIAFVAVIETSIGAGIINAVMGYASTDPTILDSWSPVGSVVMVVVGIGAIKVTELVTGLIGGELV